MVGLCPGPAVAALGVDGLSAVVFVAAMLAGMAGYHLTFERRTFTSGPFANAKP